MLLRFKQFSVANPQGRTSLKRSRFMFNNMASNKRPHKTITLSDKSKILEYLDKGGSIRQVAGKFGVPKSTIYDIKKNSSKIRNKVPTSFNSADSMPLTQRLSADDGPGSSQPVLHSQPLSPTKLKVTRQSVKHVAPPPVSPPKQPDLPKEPPNEEVCLRWNSHHSNMQTVFPNLLMREQYVDVTMVAEGQTLKCHRMILSSCSPYFESILDGITPFQHPVLFMNNIPFWVLKSLCDYMYAGEVHIFQNKLEELLAVAETLKIKGLAGKVTTETKTEPQELLTPNDKEKEEMKSFERRSSEKKASEKKLIEKKSTSSEHLVQFPHPSKFNRDNDEDALLDPLDLLEPLYEVEEKHKPHLPIQKPKEIKNLSIKKSLQKKVKKRKFTDRDPIKHFTRRTAGFTQTKTIQPSKPIKPIIETRSKSNKGEENVNKKKFTEKKLPEKKTLKKKKAVVEHLITIPLVKFDTTNNEDNILLDPLELLDPLCEVEEKQQKQVPVTRKIREVKSLPQKTLRKRMHVDLSPPPVFHFRKGTRSRPNVKIPKYYHSSYDNKSPHPSSPVEALDQQLPLQDIPIEIQEPSSSTATSIIPQRDPLLGPLEIKPEPLEVDEHDVIIYSDNDTLMQEEESIIGNFDSPIVNPILDMDQDVEVVEHSLDDVNIVDDSINIGETSSSSNRIIEESTASFPKIKLVAPIITEVRSIIESSPKTVEESTKQSTLEVSEPMETQPVVGDPAVYVKEKDHVSTSEDNRVIDDELTKETIQESESDITQSKELPQSANTDTVNTETLIKEKDSNIESSSCQMPTVESSSNLTESEDIEMPVLEPVETNEDNLNIQTDAPNIVEEECNSTTIEESPKSINNESILLESVATEDDHKLVDEPTEASECTKISDSTVDDKKEHLETIEDQSSESIEQELTELLAEPSSPSTVPESKSTECEEDVPEINKSEENQLIENPSFEEKIVDSKEIDVINEIEKTIQLLNAIGGSNEKKLNEIASSSSVNTQMSEGSSHIVSTVDEESSKSAEAIDAAPSSSTLDSV